MIDEDFKNEVMALMEPDQFRSMCHNVIRYRQRRGQAFFNALPAEDRDALVGTSVDPFYKTTWYSCWVALEYLTSPDRRG